jgi:ribosomal protein S4
LYFYGKKIQRLIKKKKLLRAFGSRFFFTLAFLELRLNIILLRILFSQNIIETNSFIRDGFFLVNKKIKNKNYLVKVTDLIHKKNVVYLDVKTISYK